MGYFDVPEIDYDRYTNRQLAAVPLAVLAVALLVLGGWYALYGAPANYGIEFAGGTELTVQTTAGEEEVVAAFDQEPSSLQQRGDDQYILQFTSTDQNDLRAQAEENLEPTDEEEGVVLSLSSISESFGDELRSAALFGITVAFVGMSALAFVLFRTFVPSIAIVVSAFSDIMIPLAFMNLVGIELTLGTVAGLLLLIGYSVDSDILLNTHVLKRSGGFYESTYKAMQTGVTMTVTSMAAMLVMAITAYVLGIGLLSSIGIILFVGLATDLMNTYMLNLSLLRWYKFGGTNR